MASDDGTSRRDVLRFGGMAVTLGAVLAACSSDDEPSAPDPEAEADAEAEAEAERTEARQLADADVDVSLLNTALSLEVLAIDTYQAAFDFGLIQSAPVIDAATLFQQHHREHRDLLVGAVESAGAEPFLTPNPVVRAALVDPSLASISGEGDFLTLARDLEQASAQLHVHATTSLSTQALRSTAMSIAGVAARRSKLLVLLGDLGSERLAFVPTDNPLPSDAVVPG
ncbi:MAG TPA: ferritin-like domain-containing protein [Acidimicrobiales bacterium]|nr:ferritin-like domain-containing protein [Acidimicrobiales bacterium]